MRPDVHVVPWCLEGFVEGCKLFISINIASLSGIEYTNHILNYLANGVRTPFVEHVDANIVLVATSDLLYCISQDSRTLHRDDPFVLRVPVSVAAAHAIPRPSGMSLDLVERELGVLPLFVGFVATEHIHVLSSASPTCSRFASSASGTLLRRAMVSASCVAVNILRTTALARLRCSQCLLCRPGCQLRHGYDLWHFPPQ